MIRALLCLLIVTSSALAASKYNVLYIVSDDLNCSLGCYGHPLVKTPNIDKLAARGVRFDKAYCQYPLCNPSRTSFLTGLRPDTTTIYDNGKEFRKGDPSIVTMPQSFQKAGSYVARVGKLYHYGVPTQIGTDGLDDKPSWQHVVNPIGHDKAVEDKIFTLTPGQFGGTLSWFADEADEPQTDMKGAEATIKLLEENKDKPFFIACGFFRPHTPYVAPKKFFDMYPVDQIELAKGPGKDAPDAPAAAYQSYKKEQDQLTDKLRREAKQAYFASISFMDAQVGQVVDALDKLGLAEKTIIVFHSDHGYHLGDHGLWQKQSIWEGSARVPLIVAIPDSANKGKTCARTVELVDLHATLADVCGIEAPKTDGFSMKSLLESPEAEWSHAAYSQVQRGTPQGTFAKAKKKGGAGFMGRSVRNEKYRYTEWGKDGDQGVQLYDMVADPLEAKNLASDPASAEIVKQMKALLKAKQ